MRSPLIKRIPRELKKDVGKYLVIFLFLTMLISLVSGYLVADNSMIIAYNEGFEKYNVEDGHIAFDQQPTDEFIAEFEEATGTTLYDLKYFDEEIAGTDGTIRVYEERSEINKTCLHDGRVPAAEDEIMIDRLYAKNNDVSIGDSLRLHGKDIKIVGIVALPDYSCLFENNSDMMFDSINFCVGIMTEEGYDYVGSVHQKYNYAWKYGEKLDNDDKTRAKELSDELLDDLAEFLEDYDGAVVDKAIDAGKLIVLDKALDGIEASGMELDMFDSDEGRVQLLEMIQKSLDDEGIDLKEELGGEDLDDDKNIELTVDDLKLAMDATDNDVNEAQDYIDNIDDEIITIDDYLPRYLNKAINFPGSDMGKDKAMFIMFDYIVMIVLAFVFAVTISNTITQEAGVIGTLRASGYTRGELIRHYMVLPIAVSFVAAIIGNVIGYSYIKKIMANLYYNSYSLVTYETRWNMDAFVVTTIYPLVLLFIINLVVLVRKLRLSPLRFLRRDLSSRGKKKAFRLNTKLPIMFRFRLRILFQNIPNYLTLFVGVFVGGVLIVFGTMFEPMLDEYKAMTLDSLISEYQYVLMEETETESSEAEKFCMTSLESTNKDFMKDTITIYGIEDSSRYVPENIPEGKVLVSNPYAAKFGLEVGDSIELKDPYLTKTYTFEIGGVKDYDADITVFMNRAEFNEMFDEDRDHFTGYFTNEEIADIDEDLVAAKITRDDFTKTSDQLTVSMGEMMGLMKGFGVVMFLLLMFILSKLIIEKNAQSISMTKILGFKNGEIGGLYIVATSIVVIASLVISVPIINEALRWAFTSYLYKVITGYFPFIVSKSCYVNMFICGIACYAAVAIVQLIKISRIPKTDALKNVE